MIDKTAVLTTLRSPRAKKYGLRTLVVVATIGVLGFFALPPLVKSLVVEKLGQALHRPVSVERISINPYALSLQIDGLTIQEKEGGETFAGFSRLYANVEGLASIFRGGPVLSEIKLEGPKFRIVRLADSRYNFSDLLDEAMAKPAVEPEKPAATALFSLNNIQVSKGSVEFDDRQKGVKHLVDAIDLTLPFVSSMGYATETFVEPAFAANINGAPFLLKGKSKPFANSRDSEFALELDQLQLAPYLAYSPVPLPIALVSGALDTDLKLVFHNGTGETPSLNLSGTLALNQLEIKESAGSPLLGLKRLDLSIASADLTSRKFVIDRIALDAPEIHARVDRQGDVNWLRLMPKQAPPPSGTAAPASAAPVWSLGEAKISGGALRIVDESNGKAANASIDGFDLDLRKLDSAGTAPAEFDVAWRVSAEEWLKVETFSIKGGRLDLAKHELQIGDARVKGVRAVMRRAADGSIQWVKPPTFRAVQASQKDTSAPWKVNVAKYTGEDIALRFEDASVSPASTQQIDGMAFELENISSEPGRTAKVAARLKINSKGQVSVGGNVKLFPLDTDLKLAVKAVELLPLQPYFGQKLNIAVTRGQVAVDGSLKLRQEDSANGKVLAGGFAGNATIGDFQSVDKINSADFLKWKSLYFGKVDVRQGPDSVSVGEIALSDFFARVIVSPDGKLNLLQLVRKEGQSAEQGAEKAAGQVAEGAAAPAPVTSEDGKAVVPLAVVDKQVMPVKIGKVTLQGGSVRLTDNFVKPNYTADLRQIGGRITGLSSAADSTAEVDLRGSYDNIAPLTVAGRINPLSAKPYLDIQAEIKNLELTSLSTYAGKYAGYAIDKGKLSLFVKYKIEDNQLAAENRLFVDQLTFGEAVDSPSATKLPVQLAVSLLKNRNGEIDINLPVSGSLDDPKFSIGGLIVQVIVNLLVKAVTSPFALLGLGSGGSGDLSSIDFDYGRATISQPAQQRLESLAKALIDRPTLKLEIEGRVDSAQDREGLKHARINRKVRALKREDALSKGVDSATADALEVTAEEYPALLERVYRAEKFPKPRNVVGLVKTLPVAEMEKLMVTNSVINDDDLRNLGDRRAKRVRDWLVGHEIPAERIFLLPPKVEDTDGKSEKADKERVSRANFSLK